jgi:hypothetical protein
MSGAALQALKPFCSGRKNPARKYNIAYGKSDSHPRFPNILQYLHVKCAAMELVLDAVVPCFGAVSAGTRRLQLEEGPKWRCRAVGTSQLTRPAA